MAISLVFSADKMSIMDNKAQDQFQQGLVGLSYSIVKGHLNHVIHCLQRRQGKRTATNLLSLVENQCKEHRGHEHPLHSKVSIVPLLYIWIHLLGLTILDESSQYWLHMRIFYVA